MAPGRRPGAWARAIHERGPADVAGVAELADLAAWQRASTERRAEIATRVARALGNAFAFEHRELGLELAAPRLVSRRRRDASSRPPSE